MGVNEKAPRRRAVWSAASWTPGAEQDTILASAKQSLPRPSGWARVLVGCVDSCPLRDCPHNGSTHDHEYRQLRRSPAGRHYLAAGGER